VFHNPTIKIANPFIGGKKFTSGKRALHLIRQGRAEFTDDGQLFFFDVPTVIARREVETEARLLDQHRKGVVHWNGSGDPKAQHRPGECRS
jgi:hypothetical protein